MWARRRASASFASSAFAARTRSVTLVAAAALLLAGCGEDAQQQAAREATQRHVRLAAAADYDADDAHCTQSARIGWFGTTRTETFICAVRRVDGDCDWFRVALGDRVAGVELDKRSAGCVLPP